MQQDTLTLDARIQSFWQWFVDREDDFRGYFEEEELVDKEALIEDMDNRILDFGLFAWEIGTGDSRPFYLIISPNGSKERLLLSKQIMEAAPELPAWELNYAKPARKGGLQFNVLDDFMIEREVDATPWRYALRKKEKEQVEVILEAKNVSHLDSDTQLMAGERVVNGLLGEEVKINFVYRVNLVEELEEEDKEESAPIATLKQHLEALVS